MYPIDLSHLKIAKYRRKSSEDEDRQVASLADQAAALDEIAIRLRIQPEQIAADFGESHSAKLSHRRPEFQKMVEMIQRGDANAILTWHPDRLSRNLGDVDTLVRLMEDRKLVAIITPQYMFGNAPLEKYILISECTRAKLENDNKGVNVKRGLQGKIRKGWRPGPAKIGYLNDTSRARGDRSIIPDPERFESVQQLLRFFLTGNYSVRQLRRVANNELRLRTRLAKRQGGKPLALSHLYYLLSDPFYCGKFWWKNADTGEPELHQGKHPPMITEEEFWRIQALLGKGSLRKPVKHVFPYNGLMKCGECGAAIVADEKWQVICGTCKLKFALSRREDCLGCGTKIDEMTGKKLLHYVYYHCTKQKGSCSQKAIRVELLESQIDEALSHFNISERYVRWAIDALKSQKDEDENANKKIGETRGREKAKLTGELAELNRFIIRQDGVDWQLMTKNEAIAEKNRLLTELKSLENTATEIDFSGSIEETAAEFDYAARARFWLKEGITTDKRAALARLGSNLTLSDKKLRVDLAYPLIEIEKMIEIAPEIIASLEPGECAENSGVMIPFREHIPALLRKLNAIRTYFASSGKPSWKPQQEPNPSIRVSGSGTEAEAR